MALACPHCGAKVKDGKIRKTVVYDAKITEEDGEEIIAVIQNDLTDEVEHMNLSSYYCESCETGFDNLASDPE